MIYPAFVANYDWWNPFNIFPKLDLFSSIFDFSYLMV